MTKLRIFLAEDHALVREGLKMLINGQPDMEIVGEADDGQTAFTQVKDVAPDLAIVDVALPHRNGAVLTEKLAKEMPGLRVLALTVHQDRAYVRQMILAGASGYVLKLTKPTDFLQAIRTVGAGGVYVDPMVAKKVGSNAVASAVGDRDVQQPPLTAREVELIQLIARGYSNKEIAERLSVTIKSVETYKSRIMEKLGFRSRVQLIEFAILQGWLSTAEVG